MKCSATMRMENVCQCVRIVSADSCTIEVSKVTGQKNEDRVLVCPIRLRSRFGGTRGAFEQVRNSSV